jgi:hypothetical protein
MAQQQAGIGSTFSYDPSTLPPPAASSSNGSKRYGSIEEYQNDPANQAAFNAWNQSQSGYVGKTNKANWWSQGYANSQAGNGLDDYMNGQRQLVVGGDANQKMGSLEGLSRGSLLYGQTMGQSGDNIQKAVGKYSDRLDGTDPVTEALKQQKISLKPMSREIWPDEVLPVVLPQLLLSKLVVRKTSTSLHLHISRMLRTLKITRILTLTSLQTRECWNKFIVEMLLPVFNYSRFSSRVAFFNNYSGKEKIWIIQLRNQRKKNHTFRQ